VARTVAQVMVALVLLVGEVTERDHQVQRFHPSVLQFTGTQGGAYIWTSDQIAASRHRSARSLPATAVGDAAVDGALRTGPTRGINRTSPWRGRGGGVGLPDESGRRMRVP
jgi:hypothetical protein